MLTSVLPIGSLGRSTLNSVPLAATAAFSVFSIKFRGKHTTAVDGNEAAAYVGYAFSDIGFGYPITPSSTAFELMEKWASQDKKKNAFGFVPSVSLMQSEGGVAGALHGSISTGALSTTFTSSQGLMLMIPNLFKLGTAYLPGVIHVAARSMIRAVGTMFADHSDVMACRSTGWGLLASASVQEVNDLGMAAHIASIKSGVPIIHFYDGFRTSHEIAKVERLDYDEIAKLIPMEPVRAFRERAFNPEHPQIRGAAINNDAYMQISESPKKWFAETPKLFEETLEELAQITGRKYGLFDYFGHPEPEYVVVLMGSGAETAHEAVKFLNAADSSNRYGVIKTRLYRPFSAQHFMDALPASVKSLTVLDRTREFGALGEPLYLDVSAVLHSRGDSRPVYNGVYGIGGREFTPTMVQSVFENMKEKEPKRNFVVGIADDVTNSSLPALPEVNMAPESTRQCVFWGVGADGTVGANKEAISIISDNTSLDTQGYFIFEAKKSGGWTLSNLRFGAEKIQSEYEILSADYVACHNQSFLGRYPVIRSIKNGGTFVVNCNATSVEDFDHLLSNYMKRIIADKDIQLYSIDASKIAEDLGMPGRINMIMQTVFFKLAGVVDVDLALRLLKEGIEKNYGKKGKEVVEQNIKSVDMALEHLWKVEYPAPTWKANEGDPVSRFDKYDKTKLPVYIKDVVFPALSFQAAKLPVSAFASVADGRFPLGSSYYEKRDITLNVPVWDQTKCSKCNYCSLICPHAAIRPFLLTEEELKNAPANYTATKDKVKGHRYSIQVSPYDCLGCNLCAEECPDGALKMTPVREVDTANMSDRWDYSYNLEDRSKLFKGNTAAEIEYRKPLLEFSGACAGCTETSYAKLLTQLFGDRMYIANATGCSLIWGAHFPSMAYTVDSKGHGPAWGNSLFEDNAEYGFGMLRATETRRDNLAIVMEQALASEGLSDDLRSSFTEWIQNKHNADKSRAAGDKIKQLLEQQSGSFSPVLKEIYEHRDLYTKPSHWIVGGDGWAYDIGYGGLDHVLAQDKDINAFVFDNEAYANTGFQVSKSTPHGGVVKFAASGKKGYKKDLGMIAMQYGHIYVASVSLGGNQQHLIRCLLEAEAYPGPSLIIAYCPCIGHGIHGNMCQAIAEERLAVETGYWPLYRFNPLLKQKGQNPFKLVTKNAKTKPVEEFLKREVRFTALERYDKELADKLHVELQKEIDDRWELLKELNEKKAK